MMKSPFSEDYREQSKTTVGLAVSLDGLKPNRLEYWRNLWIYFWVFSVVGHIIELVWDQIYWVTSQQHFPHIIPTITPVAPPYGLGVAIVSALVYPWVKSGRHSSVLRSFLISTVILSVVELLCSRFVKLLSGGVNKFWDYTNSPFNLWGDIYLKQSLLFGLAGVLIVYLIFPRTEKLFHKTTERRLNEIFFATFITYALDVAFLFIKDGVSWVY